MQASTPHTDGRRRRSQQSRDRIITAIMSLVEDGDTNPGAEAVAARAQVGLRSVFRHFNDMESLFAEMTARVAMRYQTALLPFEATEWRGQIREALGRRLVVYKELLPFRRASDLYRARSRTVQANHDRLQAILRSRLETIVPEAERQRKLWFEQLDLMMSFEVYERLRIEQKLEHEVAVTLITDAVETLIA